MIDKYIHLSLDSALEVLRQWASASTKLRLTAASALAGVSFSGCAQVVNADDALSVRFAFGTDTELGITLFDVEALRASAEEPRRWLAFDKPGDFRFVLEINEGEPLEEINLDDFDCVSVLEQ